jgi:glycosyltransferase involved in cell wall biosynthesis
MTAAPRLRIRALHAISAWGGGHVETCFNLLKGLHQAGGDVHLDIPRIRTDIGAVPHRTSIAGPLARYSFGRFEQSLIDRSIHRFQRDLRPGDVAWIWPSVPLWAYRAVAAQGVPIVMEGINSRIANARRILEPIHAAEGLPPPFDTTHGPPEAEEEAMLALASYHFAPNPLVAEALTAPDSAFRGQVIPTSYGAWRPETPPPDRSARTRALKVLFVGAVSLRKNAHGLLRAWAALAPQNARLILCGGIEDHIARICAQELALPSVEARGHVRDMGATYAEADIFVMPSFEEGGPQVTFEAAMMGLPLITSPMGDGGISAEGRDTAYPIDPYSVASMAEALERFLSEADLRADYGARSSAVAPTFDWSVVGRKRVAALRQQG